MIRLDVAGKERTFPQDRLVIGRAVDADIRFDPERELEVSSSHAEITVRNGTVFLRDLGSTNGTFLNGARIGTERTLNAGDKIKLGTHGPTIELLYNAGRVTQRIDAAVAKNTKSLTLKFAFAAALLVVIAAVTAYKMAGKNTAPAQPPTPANSQADYSSINNASGAAVTLIAVQMPSGTKFTGTGFNVDSTGLILTNRHLILDKEGNKAARILAIFANTAQWLPAQVAWINDSADVAALRIDPSPKRYPVVSGVSRSSGKVSVGSQVAISGFPLGIATPMEGSGVDITARATLGAGIVSKILPNLIQVDAYATDGSSGSPLFSRDGQVVGIVYGGLRESNGRIVLALPSEMFIPYLATRR